MNLTLTALIREIAEANPECHPHKIARLVAERTEPDDLFEFYVSALERLVSDRIRVDRNKTLNSGKGRSAKLEERRSWWARFLSERVYVGEHRYKLMAECTIDDLTYCIKEREDQIGALRGQIAKYETIIAAMAVHGAGCVGDLPEGAVEL